MAGRKSPLSRIVLAVANGVSGQRGLAADPSAVTTLAGDSGGESALNARGNVSGILVEDPVIGDPLGRLTAGFGSRARYFDARSALMGALAASRDTVFVVEHSGTIIFTNRCFSRQVVDRDLFGLLRKGCSGAVDEVELRFFLEPIGHCLSNEEEISDQVASLGEGSEQRMYRLSVHRFTADGWHAGMVAIFTDVTELHRLQRELYHTERLAEVGKLAAKSAHEIKNQIAAMRATAQLASMLPDPAEKDRFLHHITESIDNLKGFVSELAQISSPVDSILEPGNAVELMRKAVKLMRPSFRQKGIELVDDLPDDLAEALIDERALRQAFVNLLTNALEATDRGGKVRLTAWVVEGVEGVRRLALEIADTGSGIPPEIKTKLFTPFLTTKKGGAGLGLVVTQQVVVDSHGGAIRVDSQEGEGTRVTVELRLADPG